MLELISASAVEIFLEDSPLFNASFLISPATTEKPFPYSPALEYYVDCFMEY